MTDAPRADELVEAVRLFVEDIAGKALSGHAAFHARVAGNVLALLRRELTEGPQAALAEERRLKALLDLPGDRAALNVELCRRIRAGEIGPTTPGLAAHVIATTMAKVAIDQPSYSGLRTAQRLFGSGR